MGLVICGKFDCAGKVRLVIFEGGVGGMWGDMRGW